MPIDVDAAVTALARMTVTQLRHRYGEVFGEPSRSFNKQHLVKRIAWRLQAIHEGDLSERARRRARELANDADLRIRPPAAPSGTNGNGETTTSPFRVEPDDRLPMAGTLLKREYKGQTVQVRVLPQGFEFDGEVYRSLSAVARKITGAHWNGFHFFGLPKPGGEGAE
ncbi:MAG: DUF2924 domain-containing protein [Phycisphaerae bacterium]|nr:DUF2924 domain-containing protein [Phycisphaerae bacterium]NUQ47460.1 DUF2924 domain-containing protein [Phycisphaerae bacterium]